jgi:hypothetical protein
VLTPTFIPGLNVSVDWYNLDLRGAVGVIQPIAAITSCYVTNPTASNPLCGLVTRNPTTAPSRMPLSTTRIWAACCSAVWILPPATRPPRWLPGKGMRFSYQGNIVTSYLIQANSTVSAVQCKGTFGATCSSDGTTLVQPAYRHTAGMGWLFDKGVVQFDWNRIGKVRSSTVGSTETSPRRTRSTSRPATSSPMW